MTTTNKPIPVWRDGKMVEETHLVASGNPPVAPAPVQSEEWTIVEGWEQSGIEVRWLKGKTKQYRARAWIDDERYPGDKGPRYSKEYRAVDQAEPSRFVGYHANPGEMQRQLDISQAVARSHMDPAKEASLTDMRRYLKELEADLLYPYKAWQMAHARHVERLAATQQLIEQVDTMFTDINEHGWIPKYELFISQLQELLSAKGKE